MFDPTPEQIADIILRREHSYWLQGGNGEATIDVLKEPGDGLEVARRLIRSDGKTVEYAAGQPSLWIKQPEPGRFFFTWSTLADGWFVPYDGSDCEVFVMDERGGDPFKIPRACLVDRAAAVAIATDFIRSLGRCSRVAWIAWDDL